MDASQQTPTQVNEDRDYEICDSLPSSPAQEHTGPTWEGNEERTLQDDDTGAVNFGNCSPFARPSSQVSEDGGFEKTKGHWTQADNTSQQLSSHAFTPFKPQGAPEFETPALPKNPFGAKIGVAAPFAGSQLFGQTQFSSAVKPSKITSPTSSRPSPNVLHNSISPNAAETSPLKNRTNVSSPTDIRTSSPNRVDEVPATVCRPKHLDIIVEETPSASRSAREERVPGSPTNARPRSAESHQPLVYYESVKKSQERKNTDDSIYQFVGSDSEDDEALRRVERRKRVERKKAQAAREMEKVHFTPVSRSNANDRPSMKRRRTLSGEVPEIFKAPILRASDTSKSSGEQPLIVDSQNRIASASHPVNDDTTQGTEDPPEDELGDAEPVAEPMAIDEKQQDETYEQDQLAGDERIPATSPLGTPVSGAEEDPQPQSQPELPGPQKNHRISSPPKELETSSLPPTRQKPRATYGRKPRPTRGNIVITSSASEVTPHKQDISTDSAAAPTSSPTSTVATDGLPNGQPKADATEKTGHVAEETNTTPRRTSPSRSAKASSVSKEQTQPPPTDDHADDQLLAASSSLSSLSSAPSSSQMSTPPTRDSPAPDHEEIMSLPSPVGSKNLKKGTMRSTSQSISPQPMTRHTRLAKQRAPHYGSESTDELQLSPSGSVLAKSVGHYKASRTFRQSIGPVHRTGGIFEGMVFAISLQTNGVKAQDRTKLEAKISQAGGAILSEGFEELFDNPSIVQSHEPVFDQDEPMTLCRQYAETGFTALIADGHSRKAKYMQALALGLPCLASQWVTACLSKGKVVDWEPYLLCSGASAVLGNALRSRNLIPYSAADARLAEAVGQRRKLLEGKRVLVVVDSRKGRSEAKQPYIFLARALGPSMSRVSSVEAARGALTDHIQEKRQFDWIYVDQGTGAIESVLTPATNGGAKKRKRASTMSPFGNIRVLNDEMIIQSLILGRMVEADEINF